MVLFDFLLLFRIRHELVHGQELVDTFKIFHDQFLGSLLLRQISLVVFILLLVSRRPHVIIRLMLFCRSLFAICSLLGFSSFVLLPHS